MKKKSKTGQSSWGPQGPSEGQEDIPAKEPGLTPAAAKELSLHRRHTEIGKVRDILTQNLDAAGDEKTYQMLAGFTPLVLSSVLRELRKDYASEFDSGMQNLPGEEGKVHRLRIDQLARQEDFLHRSLLFRRGLTSGLNDPQADSVLDVVRDVSRHMEPPDLLSGFSTDKIREELRTRIADASFAASPEGEKEVSYLKNIWMSVMLRQKKPAEKNRNYVPASVITPANRVGALVA